MSDIPQFFRKPNALPQSPEGTDVALYRIPDPGGGEDLTIMVEVVEGTGNVPRNATYFDEVVKKFDLQEQLKAAAAMARVAMGTMRELAPGEMEIEFGVELGGEMGFPKITKIEGRANFKITLKWKAADNGERNE